MIAPWSFFSIIAQIAKLELELALLLELELELPLLLAKITILFRKPKIDEVRQRYVAAASPAAIMVH